MLQARGWTIVRRGKGDHTIYRNARTGALYSLDGAPSHELPKGAWEKLKKRLRNEER